MIVSLRGETFVWAIDYVGSIKYGLYTVNILSFVIDKFGAKNVVKVVMDNAKNCK